MNGTQLLKGRTAIVTGGGGRLGHVIGATLLREGARVVFADLTVEIAQRGLAAASGTKDNAIAVAANVLDEKSIDAMFEKAEAEFGLPDILVTAHGVFPNVPLLEMTAEEWDRPFDINVRGCMFLSRWLARRWVAEDIKGSIVNITSGAARSARAGSSHYASSKAAMNMVTEVLAIELGPHGIRVNAIAPGLIMDDVLTEDSTSDYGYVNDMIRATPLRRTGAASDVAEAVAFLASDRSPWTTGAVLEITGGSHCGRTHMPLSRDLK